MPASLKARSSFMAGAMTYCIVISAIQDIYGLEGWIAYLRTHWLTGSWNVVNYVAMVLVLLYWSTPERSNS